LIIRGVDVSADPYKVLQVDPDAEPEVVRAAYRALALKYHPDLSTGSHERMAELNRAWGLLRSASARAAYDQARSGGGRASNARAAETPTPAGTTPATPGHPAAGETPEPRWAAPRGRPSGSVLDFGRYAGWSLGQVAVSDPVYLEWLARTPIGRTFAHEIDALLAGRAARAAQKPAFPRGGEQRRARFGRP
jgi:curved DNA-binding protein CbpA